MEFDFWTVATLVLGVLAAVFGVFLFKAKGKAFQAFLLGKEALELVKTVLDAAADNRFDDAEQASIKKEAQDVKEAFRTLLGKE